MVSIGPKGEYKPADVIGCAVNFAKKAITGELEEFGLKQSGKHKLGTARAQNFNSTQLSTQGTISAMSSIAL